MILKWLGWIILGLLVAGFGIWAFFNRKFFGESMQELKKVTWPTKDEALNSALITIGFIVVFSLVLAGFDAILYFVVMKLVK